MFVPPPFHERRPGLVAPVRHDPDGLRGPTPGVARGPRWRTTSRGLFVPHDVPATSFQRTVEAAAVLTTDEAVTGWAALAWTGGRWFDGTIDGATPRDVHVVARRHIASQAGWRVSQEFLHPDEIVVVDGLPVTTHVRSVTYEMRYAAALGDAVVALDMACYSDLVSIAEVTTYLSALGPVTGIQQARDALVEADENSWSPRETRMRGVWTKRALLPRPLCNVPVFDGSGRHVGTPDLISPEMGLVGLYNGSDHLSLVGAAADEKKSSDYRDVGLEVVTMLATDWSRLSDFIARLHAGARRARPLGGSWTVDPPAWWTPTHTVARRRALTDLERHRYLRYRGAA
ncbi:hypothetical protein L2K70_03870 [Nocardioides KLBMP 9356]|uniref:Uncharacterized protein n=1 Tax=Nocardioides potassii TaxID=2911371 RepID=A0ABS9H663_9ACTN|nr:hypothetical protein [Nocardioides potassii]MCF6376732.1 hypothetical protein [Nocardioides potassii]